MSMNCHKVSDELFQESSLESISNIQPWPTEVKIGQMR